MAEIIVMFGDEVQGKYIFNQGEIVIGRTRDCDIVLDNLAVSRRHARLSRDDDGFHVTDLGSGNGTYLNGQQIDQSLLKDDDRIAIGKHKLIFRDTGSNVALASDIFGAERTRLVGKVHMAYVEVIAGKQKDVQFRLEKPKMTIGRAHDCDIVLQDWRVAKQQAVISRKGEKYVLRDESGQRRTQVNDYYVQEAVLKEGDQIHLGNTILVFGLLQEEVPPAE
jgi:pSer/pThr/pTyr-binding forkhead associated (FHA) protein